MTFHKPSVPHPLHSAPADPEDHERDSPLEPPDPDDQDKGDRFEPPSPASPDIDRLGWNYERGIYGDERGGQVPKRP